LHYRKKVLVPTAIDAFSNERYVVALMGNVATLGFTFSKELKDALSVLSSNQIADFAKEIAPLLKKMVGAHVKYQPLFRNFPEGVPENTYEFFLKRVETHLSSVLGIEEGDLLSCGHIINTEKWDMQQYNGCPICNQSLKPEELTGKQPNRPSLEEVCNEKVLELGTEEEFFKIFTNLVGAKSSISEYDKEVVKWFVTRFGVDINRYIPNEIPYKENLTYLAAQLSNTVPDVAAALLSKHIKTATDVLRLAVGLSGGDVSLAKDDKFISFNRIKRRILLNLLEAIPAPVEDMLRSKQKWKRLGERLHPGEFRNKFPKSVKAFDYIRKDLPFETFNSKVETALGNENLTLATALLSKRPGDFARRLDHMLRLDPASAEVVKNAFLMNAGEVSTPVLLQLFAFYKARHTQTVRAVLPKGNVAKMKAIPVLAPTQNEEFYDDLTTQIRNTLVARFKLGEPLGKVYLDEKLDDFFVPFSQRSAAKALRTIVRGSRVPLGDKKYVRFFLHWKDGESRTDIDLSATLYSADFNYLGHLSYTNYRGSNYEAVHSGDFTSAPNGAAEFIDLNIDSIVKFGARYVVMQVYSFTHQPFCDLPECFAGVMEREDTNRGGTFDARTVTDKFDLSADTKTAIPAVLDLVDRKMIWADLGLGSNTPTHNNVESNGPSVALACKTLVHMDKATMADLALMHIEARGERVEKREEADVTFALDGQYNPYDVDVIMADLL